MKLLTNIFMKWLLNSFYGLTVRWLISSFSREFFVSIVLSREILKLTTWFPETKGRFEESAAHMWNNSLNHLLEARCCFDRSNSLNHIDCHPIVNRSLGLYMFLRLRQGSLRSMWNKNKKIHMKIEFWCINIYFPYYFLTDTNGITISIVKTYNKFIYGMQNR